MPVVLLHQQDHTYATAAISAAQDADRAVGALGDLAADLAQAAGSSPEGPKSAARATGFDALEQPYRQWLESLAEADDPFERREVWQREVRDLVGRLGDRLVEAAGDVAWEGRTVDGKKGVTLWLNAGLADVWFRGRLSRALGAPGTGTPGEGNGPARGGADDGPSGPADQPDSGLSTNESKVHA
jgi:CRISPR system Cascade subunit CasA